MLAYRDIADTEAMIEAAKTLRHAVVIGGGLLGLEAANGLMKRGMQVTVVHVGDWLMERQARRSGGPHAAEIAGRARHAVLHAGADAGAAGDAGGRVRAVRFKDGSEIPAELVVMAVGIRPSTELAESMHLHVSRGIVVSDTLQTVTDPRIYAVGECAAHRGIAYGLVAPCSSRARYWPTIWRSSASVAIWVR